jgi:DNA uptake protein ComE-like DNA-binding protein
MKNLLVLMALVCSTAIGSNIYAQQVPPPGAGDKDLRDTDVKRRSIEMERIDRDARKPSQSPQARATRAAAVKAEDKLAAKYAEIKTDYEQIQMSQDAIIKAYQSTGKIDFAQIGKSALEIKSSATRLKSNLFPALPVESADGQTQVKKEEETGISEMSVKMEKDRKSAKGVRDLIVDLDNAVGSFATSPMFQNLRVVDAAVSAKAKLDLEKIIELSAVLEAEAQKMNGTGK